MKINNMKEQTITLQTAWLAKEKGFNEHTDEVFAETIADEWEDHHTGNIIRSKYQPPRVRTQRYLDSNDREVCKAPTQSLLQKWLREKFGTHITIIHYSDCPTVKLHNVNYDDSNGSFEWRFSRKEDAQYRDYCETIEYLYETYEQALEKALYESMLLITTN